MNEPSTRDAIIEAGRHLFGERGYSAVTIKDVATRAGYSPAMVMKVMGSKAKLYAAAAPDLPTSEFPHGMDEPIGFTLIRRILARRQADESEPWAMVPLLVQDSPEPAAARRDLRQRYVSWIAGQIHDTSPDRQKSQLVVCAVMGLAAGVRTLGLLGPEEIAEEQLVQQYGALVQGIID
ncbi:TetR/AcrR family transcriptional regulator [Specibacter cremeus]|uniref:TetR/AcrR family transcriptional regulator n=1 Tax=Specibacter cremeus TaxID=1629051 RepID=UPI000F78A1CA|nr:TetR/AcrR family transcriptional regulator [Specibacter cremeus]